MGFLDRFVKSLQKIAEQVVDAIEPTNRETRRAARKTNARKQTQARTPTPPTARKTAASPPTRLPTAITPLPPPVAAGSDYTPPRLIANDKIKDRADAGKRRSYSVGVNVQFEDGTDRNITIQYDYLPSESEAEDRAIELFEDPELFADFYSTSDEPDLNNPPISARVIGVIRPARF